jgi:hypothetical protein
MCINILEKPAPSVSQLAKSGPSGENQKVIQRKGGLELVIGGP